MELVKMVYGSHLYGLSTPDSDIDYKGINIPELNDLLLSKASRSVNTSTGKKDAKNSANDVDNEIYSLHYFVQLALKGETAALDMLHCTEPVVTSPEWEFLVTNRKMFYTKKLKAFMGYLKSQVAKYSIKGARLSDVSRALNVLAKYAETDKVYKLRDIWEKLPEGEFLEKVTMPTKTAGDQTFYEVNAKKFQNTNEVNYVFQRLQHMYDAYGDRAKLAEKNGAIDWKAVSHALRAGYQLRDIYTEGDYKYPLKETDYLLEVKTGKVDFKSNAQLELDRIMDEVKALAIKVDLPDKPNHKFWENWVLEVYRKHINLGE